jgi:putative intracellular protease/amidase
LDGKQATGWDGDNQLAQLYAQSKVSYAPEHVVVCDDIVTAVGPAQAEEFAQALVNLLKDSRY